MLTSLMLKSALVLVATVLMVQWLIIVFKTDRSLYLFGIKLLGASGHNMVIGNIGGMMLGIAGMTLLFVFHSPLWMYPLMLLALTVLIGRLISFAQKGRNSIGLVGTALEVLGLAIFTLFATNVVHY